MIKENNEKSGAPKSFCDSTQQAEHILRGTNLELILPPILWIPDLDIRYQHTQIIRHRVPRIYARGILRSNRRGPLRAHAAIKQGGNSANSNSMIKEGRSYIFKNSTNNSLSRRAPYFCTNPPPPRKRNSDSIRYLKNSDSIR